MASRCSFNTVVDPFCGAGGNAIQLALTCHRVIAVDVDPAKIKLARRNAQIYGVEKKIDFRVGNCFDILDRVHADAVVTSPPWGGPGYSKHFDANDLCSREAGGMSSILSMARKIAPRTVLHVPKTVD
uniref:Trimethylguanosine synthase n=1 Tax=Sipha flava TaxID=143950 RepID=A0A2S2QLV3_9HEMI